MSITALVADESAVMRKIIIRSLKAVGVDEVVEVGDGASALESFASQDVQLVLTDWNIPVKSGLELVKGIRGSGSQIPIIMVTTEVERSRVMEAIAAGVTDYLVKPFEADALREKLRRYIPA